MKPRRKRAREDDGGGEGERKRRKSGGGGGEQTRHTSEVLIPRIVGLPRPVSQAKEACRWAELFLKAPLSPYGDHDCPVLSQAARHFISLEEYRTETMSEQYRFYLLLRVGALVVRRFLLRAARLVESFLRLARSLRTPESVLSFPFLDLPLDFFLELATLPMPVTLKQYAEHEVAWLERIVG